MVSQHCTLNYCLKKDQVRNEMELLSLQTSTVFSLNARNLKAMRHQTSTAALTAGSSVPLLPVEPPAVMFSVAPAGAPSYEHQDSLMRKRERRHGGERWHTKMAHNPVIFAALEDM